MSAEVGEKKARKGWGFCGLLFLGLLLVGWGFFNLLLGVRSGAARTNCANNLRQVGVSSIAYMNNNTGPGNRSGFMPHVRGVD